MVQQRTVCASTEFYTHLKEGMEKGESHRFTELDKYDIHQCHQLLIPINIGNNHWILAQLRNLQKISKDFFKIRAKSVTLP
jgi:Ulp1 family protease